MRATNRKNMRADKYLHSMTKSFRHVLKRQRATRLLSTFLGLGLLLSCSFGCAPPPSSTGDGKQNESSSSAPGDIPEINDEKIQQEINDVYIREVPEENGAGEPISWRIDEDEPKEFTVVEKQIEGDRATIVLEIKTQSAPGARTPRYLTGQIRTKWKMETGWALRTWEIVDTENVSLKYKNLPKPPAQNANR